MIAKDCKRLAEVDFPIAEVSRHSAREKAIRHGHPSTLHLWWARRPLASSRGMLLALLWPDPCDVLCPPEFKVQARRLLPQVPGCNPGITDEDLRRALFRFIADFSSWDVASQEAYLEISRALVKAAHGGETPVVVDPFAGGGSIPLEALRLGCEAFASDLNPVACLILKVLLEDIPRHGAQLADELTRVGGAIRHKAEGALRELYPADPDGATPIAYLWARTVRCESPNCGAEIPLVRSFWLCKKASRRRALSHRIVRAPGQVPQVAFEVFEPKAEKDVSAGTVARAKATCLCCGVVLSPQRVRAQLSAQRGGADAVFDEAGRRVAGARLLAVVTLRPGEPGRHYRVSTPRDYVAVRTALGRVEAALHEWIEGGRNGPCPVPDEPMPWRHGHRSIQSPRVYGMQTWGDYFSARQKVALGALTRGVTSREDPDGSAPPFRELIALLLSKFAELASANCRWEPVAECPRSIFTRHDLPATWDFAEGVPLSSSSGGFDQTLANVVGTLQRIGGNWAVGQVQQADARHSPLPKESANVWFTDPPYYDAVAYADLSDFFFVWLKRALPGHVLLRDPADPSNPLVPKRAELTVTTVAGEDQPPKTSDDFERGVRDAFAEGKSVLSQAGIGCVVFAHKTTEGWEALLSGMLTAGWVIKTSWPVATEMGHRFNARNVAALGTSVHLICRPRPDDAAVGDWADVLRELPTRVVEWMERLQREGVRGADLVFACIGPALEIFSRYARVETAEGREVPLAEFLEKVWEVVGRSALAQVLGTAEESARDGAVGAVEEDARLTALFLWTLQSTNDEAVTQADDESDGLDAEEEADDEEEETGARGKPKGFTLVFDVVRRFAQPLGIDLPRWEGRVIDTKKGVVRLLPIAERAKQLFGDDGAQAVAARLEQGGEVGTNPLQGMLFPELEPAPRVRGRARGKATAADVSDESLAGVREATTLDRVHAGMLLQAGGRTNALRALLKAEQERGPEFLRLANAFSALYPKGSEEKRLVEAMLLAVPR